MEKGYTESELRQKLIDNADQISQDLVGRLRDDNFFKIHSLSWSGTLLLDGKPVSNWEDVSKIFDDALEQLIPEFISCILVTLFGVDAP